MVFRLFCSAKEIEAPDIETAEQIIKNSLREFIWLIPVTETPEAPPAREPVRPNLKVKEKKGGMTFRH